MGTLHTGMLPVLLYYLSSTMALAGPSWLSKCPLATAHQVSSSAAHLLQELHGDSGVADAGHLVRGHEALPVATQPVTRRRLVLLQALRLLSDMLCAMHVVAVSLLCRGSL